VTPAEERAARVARSSYGRLLALLASRYSDISLAEDALADAFRLALEHWPRDGVPDNPEGWLMTTAKNRRLDVLRRTTRSPVVAVEELPDAIDEDAEDREAIPDKRLQLMFVCAHPAIDASVHTPLMLQVVLGFESADIGRAFLTSPAALQQRLVRAKRKIKDSGISFSLPDRHVMPERIDAVLEAVYGAYALSWQSSSDGRDMTGEAQFLSQLLAQLLPQEPEILGLDAILCFIQSRKPVRGAVARYIPLHEQDASLWDAALVARGEANLLAASRLKKIGRYQLEAAIQHAHVRRVRDRVPAWPAVLALAEGLCRMFPTAGAHAERIAALAEVKGPRLALNELESFQASLETAFQPIEALRADLLARLGESGEARKAYDKAISITVEPQLRAWLAERRDVLETIKAP
jgi:RNA polymerase sigma-70 factor, ECF subfamily